MTIIIIMIYYIIIVILIQVFTGKYGPRYTLGSPIQVSTKVEKGERNRERERD